jgi:anti-anti-sigma factor
MEERMIQVTTFDLYSILEFKIDEFDLIRTPKISEKLNKILDEIEYSNAIMDLQHLNYIDSMGLSTLINVSRKLHEKNSEMVVVCNTTKILQLFNIAQIESFFKIFPSISTADEYFTSKGA